ncbi:MAG: DNA repair protein RecO [Methylococcales bacterium]|nr:DNA repair protein RecO [Methylococcales bacterium]
MSDSVTHLQPAFILRHKKYRETSLILDVLTQEKGLVSVLARGVRKKKSTLAGLLLPFTPLKLSYLGKKPLKILTYAELDSLAIDLKGLSLYCGFYVNELLLFLLYKNDAHSDLYHEYYRCLLHLKQNPENIEEILRFFELDVMKCLGYGLQLDYEGRFNTKVEKENNYLFNHEFGIIEHPQGYITGLTLLALEARQHLDKKALHEAKALMRKVIDFQLQGKVLKSRRVLAKIIQQL